MTKLLKKQRDIEQKIESILADSKMFEDTFIMARNVYGTRFKYHNKFKYDPQSKTWNSDARLDLVTAEQIRQCLKFLLVCELTNRKNLQFGFYYLKHRVEGWGKSTNNYMYISQTSMEIACLMCDWPVVYEERKMFGIYGTNVRDYYIKIVIPDILEKRNAVENLDKFWESPVSHDEPCTVFEFTEEEEEQIDNLLDTYIEEEEEQIDDDSWLHRGEEWRARVNELRKKAEMIVWNKKNIPNFDEWFAEYQEWWLQDFCFDYNSERESVGLRKVSIKNAAKKLWDALKEQSVFESGGWVYAYAEQSEVKYSPSEYPIKVGYTKKYPPTDRIKSATRSFSRPPVILGIWEATYGYRTERMFHKLLEKNGCSREKLQGREWFMCRKDVFEHVVKRMGLIKVET